MLIEKIRDAYRELTGDIDRANPIVAVPARRPAANASSFDQSRKQARRLRRQRRLDRSTSHRIGGWAVRTW